MWGRPPCILWSPLLVLLQALVYNTPVAKKDWFVTQFRILGRETREPWLFLVLRIQRTLWPASLANHWAPVWVGSAVFENKVGSGLGRHWMWTPGFHTHVHTYVIPPPLPYLHKTLFSSEFLIKATPHLQGLCSNQPSVLHTVKSCGLASVLARALRKRSVGWGVSSWA